MGILALSVPSSFLTPFPTNFLIGVPIVIGGLGITVWHGRLFSRVGTNINTFNKPDKLVTEGLFRYTRNPMYLGFLIALLGFAILFQGSISAFVIALFFFAVANWWYIPFEENGMRQKFGPDYDAYCQTTRRWI